MAKTKAETTTDDIIKQVNGILGEGTLRRGSDPTLEVTFLPTGVLPVDVLLQGGLPRGRFTEIFGDYCLAPQTMILCADLYWRRLDELQVGDELVGFDEQEQGRARTKYRRAVVESLGTAVLPTYEIVNDQGEITYASDGHLWLVRTPQKRMWKRTDELQTDDRIVWFGSPWEYDDSRDAGWLAGIYDGEGWLTDTRVGVAQNSGDVLDDVIRLLEERDFTPAMSVNTKDCKTVRLLGGKYEELRLLGSIRPERLLKKADLLWEGKATWSKTSGTTRVVSVKHVGNKGVVTIGTSTKTLIADGMLSHNSTLKSFVGLSAIARTQEEGGVCAIIDTEHAFDPEWAESQGVDTDSLIVLHPPTGELAVDATEVLIRQGVDLIVWDSVAATLPQAEQQKSSQDKMQPARLAALMSAAMRKLTAANTKSAILCINQTRINVGVMFGSPEAVPGGKALPFYASYRIALRKAGKITEDIKVYDGEKYVNTKSQVGQKIKMTVEKSKLNKPHREMWFTFDLKEGRVDETGFLINAGLEMGLVLQEGNSWRVKGSKTKTVGRPKFHGWLDSNPKSKARLRQMVLDGSDRQDRSKGA